jgi:hypothetical protein
VTLLAARAAEGTGDSDTAERLAHEALTAQPDLPAALLDVREYAACRGDARVALTVTCAIAVTRPLRRCGARSSASWLRRKRRRAQ